MISAEYGNFLGQFNWTHIATVRPNFKLNERGAHKIGNTLFKRPNVNRVFYSTEYDKNLQQSHMHILFHSDHNHLTKKDVAMMIGYKNNTSYVNYLENPEDNEAVAMYCSKTIGKKQLCYDIMI